MDDIGDFSLTEDIDRVSMKPQSPGVMITTLLLLIAALVLTSFTLFFHATETIEDKDAFLAALQTSLQNSTVRPAQTQAIEELAPTETVEKSEAVVVNEKKKIKKGGFFSRAVSVKWPTLKYTGYLTSTKTGGIAIINGRQVLLNETIEGVKLVEIRSQDIVVELDGQRKNVAIEQ